MFKPLISIGISAYNEEQHIENLLRTLISQDNTKFSLQEIIVILDNCSDKTFEKVNKVTDKRISIVNDFERKGKTLRVNQIIDTFVGDILIILDADIEIYDSSFINKVVEAFIEDQEIGLACPSIKPKKPVNFIQRGIYASVKAYKNYANLIENGNNVFTCVGRALALSRKLAKVTNIPETIFSDDGYLYLHCLKKGFKYLFLETTSVYYSMPKTLSDHIKQNSRFEASSDNLAMFFGNDALKAYEKDKSLFFLCLIKEFLKQPVESLAILTINLFCKLKGKGSKGKLPVAWSTATSTKNR